MEFGSHDGGFEFVVPDLGGPVAYGEEVVEHGGVGVSLTGENGTEMSTGV